METYYDPADLAAFGEIGKDAPELAKKFFDYYAEVFKEGGAHGAGEGADRPRGGAHGTVPLLHRRVYPGVSRERIEPGRDDRGGPCGDGDPGRSLSRARSTDAEDRRKAFHVGKG